MGKRIKWTPELDARLVALWPNLMLSEISREMGITEKVVNARRRHLDLPDNVVRFVRFGRVWSVADDKLLTSMWGRYALAHVAATIGCSTTAVTARRIKMGLLSTKRLWQLEPSKAQWIDAATRCAEAVGVAPANVMAGVQDRKTALARWLAWEAMSKLPGVSVAGIGRVSGFHHTSVMYGLGRLAQGSTPFQTWMDTARTRRLQAGDARG